MTRIGLWNATSSEYTSARYLRGVHYLPNSNRWLKVLEVKRRRDAGKSLYSGVDKDNDIVSNTSQSTQPPCLKEDGPPLSLATIKDFLRFHISLSKGRIDDEKRTTVDSVNTFSEWFFAGITRVTGNVIDTEDRAAVYDVRSLCPAMRIQSY